MRRRTALTSLSSLLVSGTLVVGSDAFTSVSSNRRVSVQNAGDNDSLLSLKQLGEGGRSDEDGTPEKVSFSFPGVDRRLANPELGLGTNSVYEFSQDGVETDKNGPTKGLLRIRNRGTQSVEVYSEHNTDTELKIELYDVTDSERTALRDEPAMLTVGNHVDVGFRIQTFDTNLDTFDETLTIIGTVSD